MGNDLWINWIGDTLLWQKPLVLNLMIYSRRSVICEVCFLWSQYVWPNFFRFESSKKMKSYKSSCLLSCSSISTVPFWSNHLERLQVCFPKSDFLWILDSEQQYTEWDFHKNGKLLHTFHQTFQQFLRVKKHPPFWQTLWQLKVQEEIQKNL